MDIEDREYVVTATVLGKLHEKVILGIPFLIGQFEIPKLGAEQFSEYTKEEILKVISEFPDVFRYAHASTVDYPIPRSLKQLRERQGGCANIFRTSPKLRPPLTDLIDTKRRFRWTDEADSAFEEIKKNVSQPLTSAMPDDSSWQYYVQTDSSHIEIGAVLFHLKDNGVKV
ncbi:hypothetical protein JTB14_034980 [Gonioctena quinquepunctata]|nr:hypothetical protein JTB14_034980 [Gonioctena quinquepunctata]